VLYSIKFTLGCKSCPGAAVGKLFTKTDTLRHPTLAL